MGEAAGTARVQPSRGGRQGAAGLLRDALAGLIAALVTIGNCLTFAALIFSGPWRPFLGEGVSILLVGSAIAAIATAAMSSFRVAIGAPVSAISVLLAVGLAAIAPMLVGQPPSVVLATARAAIGLATLVTAVLLLALGVFRLGRAIRFLPHPVIAGFMGATGMVMMAGAIHMSTGLGLSLETLPEFLDPGNAALLAAVVLFAAMLHLVTRRTSNPLAVPVMIAAGTALAHLSLSALGVSPAAARDMGWLFHTTVSGAGGLPILSGLPLQADWHAIARFAPEIAPIAVIAVLTTLLTASGLEVTLQTDADFDHELRAQGLANLAAGLVGGTPGLITNSYTLVARDAGGTGRACGVVVGLVTFLAMAGGAALIGLLPPFVLGGMLLMLGGRMFWTWGIASRRQMHGREWLLTVVVIALAAVFGFLPALLFGLFGGCALLALTMSRLGIVERRYGVHQWPSTHQRSEDEMAVLARHGPEALVMELAGFFFFGSAYQLYEEVRAAASAGVRLLILDFSAVIGVDSSAVSIFSRSQNAARSEGIGLILSGLDREATALLSGAAAPWAMRAASIDEALEAAENALLKVHRAEIPAACGESGWFARALGDPALAEALSGYLERSRRAAGEVLCRQGDPADSLLFVERGTVAVIVEGTGGARVRVRVYERHTVLGELGFFLGAARTATLEVAEEAVIGTLDRVSFERLSGENPPLALALMRYLVVVQAERLTFATRQLTAARG